VFFQRIYTDGLAQASFLLGSAHSRQAVVIDPRRDVEVYLDLASAHDLTITHILETHIHADYASGARELAERTGATMFLSAVGENEFPHQPVHDGDTLEVGELRLEILLTPGHTPEHICILVGNEAEPDSAPMLFSGDMLFVGAVGRPDLLGATYTQGLATALYGTIHEKLMALDDDIVVYPGHGAGSACGKAIGDAESTTMGQEKRFNYAFQPMTEESFIRLMLDDLPASPVYFPVMKQLNKRGPQILGGPPQPDELDPAELRATLAGERGAVTLIDVRPAEEFGTGFLPGSLNIGVGSSLPNWAGWSASYDRPIVLVVADREDVREAVIQLGRIGLDTIGGYVVADRDAWAAAGLPVQQIEQMSVEMAAPRIASGGARVLDVRTRAEFALGHIDGALNVSAEQLLQGEMLDGAPEQPIVVVCAAGYRSSLVTSLLKQRGHANVANLSGGMGAWGQRRDGGRPSPPAPLPTLGEGE